MASARLETLQGFVADNPEDAFARYGLAQELAKLGRLQDALAEFERLLERHPDYQAGYYHAGQTLVRLGRRDDARRMFEAGVAASGRTGDLHARSELEAALQELS